MTVVNLLENILGDLRMSNFTKVVGIVTFNPANGHEFTRLLVGKVNLILHRLRQQDTLENRKGSRSGTTNC
jgi:hypothetical protein